MNTRDRKILEIGFNAGKKAIEMHPENDDCDCVRIDEAIGLVENLNLDNINNAVCEACGGDGCLDKKHGWTFGKVDCPLCAN